MSERRAYLTDLSEGKWAVLTPLLPPQYQMGRPRGGDLRDVINALAYMDRNGCAWRRDGIWERLNAALRHQVRVLVDKEPERSAASMGSQSVKTTEAGGRCGYAGGKKVLRPKRHSLMDTLGCLLYAVAHGADLQDAEGANIVLENRLDEVPTIQIVFADAGHNRKHLHDYVWHERAENQAIGKGNEVQMSFQMLPKRWIVKQTLAKTYEYLPECSESWPYFASIHLLTKQVARERQTKIWSLLNCVTYSEWS